MNSYTILVYKLTFKYIGTTIILDLSNKNYYGFLVENFCASIKTINPLLIFSKQSLTSEG